MWSMQISSLRSGEWTQWTLRELFFSYQQINYMEKRLTKANMWIELIHCNHCIKIYLANTISSLSEPSESPHGRWVLRCQGGRSKGCALVSFKSPEEARRAAGSPWMGTLGKIWWKPKPFRRFANGDRWNYPMVFEAVDFFFLQCCFFFCIFMLSVIFYKNIWISINLKHPKAPMTLAIRSWSCMIRTLGDGRSLWGRWAKNAKQTKRVVCYGGERA